MTATVSIASDTTLTIAIGSCIYADVTTSSPFERRRVKLHKAGDNSLVFKLPNREVKTLKTTDNNALTDTTFTVRRQFVKTLNGSGVAGFDAMQTKHLTLMLMLIIHCQSGSMGSSQQIMPPSISLISMVPQHLQVHQLQLDS